MNRSLLLPTTPPEATSDADRLAAVDSYDILDTPPEQGFDDIVQLATLLCDAPVALVSLVTGDRQWFKARVGFQPCETDLGSSVCAHVLTEPDVLVIPDLALDGRTRDNPLVTGGPRIRFYGGAPLRDGDGQVLGSLCVIDTAPRPEGLTDQQRDGLRTLARQVMALLELRRTVLGRDSFIARRRQVEQRLGEAAARLQISEAHWRGLFERLNEGFLIGQLVRDPAGTAVDWRYLDVNPAWGELVGLDPAAVIGRTVLETTPGAGGTLVQEFARVVDTGEPAVFTRQADTRQRWYEGRAFALDGDRFAVLCLEITDRVRAEMRRNALLEVGDRLRELTTTAALTEAAMAIVGQALGVSRAAYGSLEDGAEYVVVEGDWTADGVPSVAGRHRLEDYGDLRQELLLGEPLIVRDVLTDPRTANNAGRLLGRHVRAFVNVPIQERGRTVATLIVHDRRPRTWSPDTVGFLRNVADRIAAAVARLRAEADQQLLNQELSHRMKNMLAMVQAVAMQTLKGVAEQAAVEVFRRRLGALARAHDVLLQQSWAAAPIHDVTQGVLGASGPIERFTFEGPTVTLGPRATLSLSLLLHELATNAAKYGALSVERGTVAIAWALQGAEDDPELVFTWTETGGPPAVEGTRTGFGSRLIRAGLLGTGGVTLRYGAAGFAAEMRASLRQVQTA